MPAAPLRHAGAALAALAAAPAAALALALRPAWRENAAERLGGGLPRVPGAVWVHAASVGEVLAATRLVDALAAAGRPVLASAFTPTGRAVLDRVRPDVPRALAPLDHPWCVARALARVRPAALALVETELWPCWIAAAARRRIPVAVVSGRLSERSAARLARLGGLARPTFARLAAVGARTAADAQRFRALGARRVEVTGDLKLEPPAAVPPLAPALAAALAGASFWAAASTHPGEEEAALDALAAAERAGATAGLLLAPRRVERADEVAAAVARRGRPLRRRSALAPGGPPLAPGEVLLLDTLGELPAALAHAAFAFVGGSLVPAGGHNVLEPAHVGRPSLFGPHVASARAAADLLLAHGGARQVADAAGLAAAVTEWLRDPAAAARAGEAARRALEPHRGAAARSVALLVSLLDAGTGA